MVGTSLEDAFPRLHGQPYQIKSPRDRRYDCIAFAAGDGGNWWWPDAAGDDFWPAGSPRTQTLEAFRDAFATLGYAVCDTEDPEPGHEKVALYALAGVPKHACRQLPTAAGSASSAQWKTSNTVSTTWRVLPMERSHSC